MGRRLLANRETFIEIAVWLDVGWRFGGVEPWMELEIWLSWIWVKILNEIKLDMGQAVLQTIITITAFVDLRANCVQKQHWENGAQHLTPVCQVQMETTNSKFFGLEKNSFQRSNTMP